MSEASQEKPDNPNIAGKDDCNPQPVSRPDSTELPEATEQQPVKPDDHDRVVRLIGSQSVSFQGPVPPPELLQEYQKIDPDLPAALIKMAQDEQKHRHEMDRGEHEFVCQLEHNNAKKTLLGQVFAFTIAMTTIGGGLVLIYTSRSTEGIAAIITALVALTGVFVYGRYMEGKEAPGPKNPIDADNNTE